MMKIGFDAKRAFFNQTGLGNYSRTLIQTLAKFHPEYQYWLYSPKNSDNPRLSEIRQFQNIKLRFPNNFVNKKVSALWRTSNILNNLKKDKIDIYHGLSHELPLSIEKTDIASVVTIHDLIFERFPKLYPYIDRKLYRWKFKSAAQRADRVVAISEQTKQDLVDFYEVDAEKIDVIYQSCAPIFYEKYDGEMKKKVRLKYNLPQNYILYVGSIIERKNLLTLVKAMHLLKNKLDIPLVVIGNGGEYKNKIIQYIRKQHLEQNILFLNNVVFQELPCIYQLSNLFVLPSIFEGFGIPIIEAQHSGIPVITSQGSCFPEAGGKHSEYIDAFNEEELMQKIFKVLTDSEKQKYMKEEGYKYVEKFKEKNIGLQWIRLYSDLSKNKQLFK